VTLDRVANPLNLHQIDPVADETHRGNLAVPGRCRFPVRPARSAPKQTT
jgi:hypothetical protein